MDKTTEILEIFINSQLTYSFGWTLLHSFWQCFAIALVLKLSLRLTRHYSANVRYLQSIAAMSLCTLLSIFTFVSYYQSYADIGQLALSAHNEIAQVHQQTLWTRIFTSINPYLQYIVSVWLIGVSVQTMRYLVDFSLSQRLKNAGCLCLPSEWQTQLEKLAFDMKVKTSIQFKLSHNVSVPCVIGHLKPVVLLPVGLFTHLSSEQVEVIVMHELAHIKRHDYLVNLFQCSFKTLFFFNPIVMWISNTIDIERENACDDIALENCGNPILFANTLSQFAEIESQHSLVMAANKDSYFLLARVKRLFNKPNNLSSAMEGAVSAMCILFLSLAASVNAQTTPLLTSPSEMTIIPGTDAPQIEEAKENLPVNMPIQHRLVQAALSIRASGTSSEQSNADVNRTKAVTRNAETVEEANTPEAVTQTSDRVEEIEQTHAQSKKAPNNSDISVARVLRDSASDFIAQENPKLALPKTSFDLQPEQVEPEEQTTEQLYRVVDTELKNLIVNDTEAFSAFNGVSLRLEDLSSVAIDSEDKAWQAQLEAFLPDIEKIIGKQISRQNKAYTSVKNARLLEGVLSIASIKHRTGLLHLSYSQRKKYTSHKLHVQVNIALNDPDTGKRIGIAEDTFYFVRPHLKSKMDNGSVYFVKRLQKNFWNRLVKTSAGKIASVMNNMKHSELARMEGHDGQSLDNLIFESDLHIEQEGRYFQVNNASYERVIIKDPEQFNHFQGIQFSTLETNHTAISAVSSGWKERTEAYFPELEKLFSEKIEVLNSELNELPESDKLLAKIKIQHINYYRQARFRSVHFNYLPEDKNSVLDFDWHKPSLSQRDHAYSTLTSSGARAFSGNKNNHRGLRGPGDALPRLVNVLVHIELVDPVSQKTIGLIEHVFYSAHKMFDSGPVRKSWNRGKQEFYWLKIRDYLLENTQPVLTNIKKQQTVEIEHHQQISPISVNEGDEGINLSSITTQKRTKREISAI